MSLRMSRDLSMFGSRKAHVCSLFFSFNMSGEIWRITSCSVQFFLGVFCYRHTAFQLTTKKSLSHGHRRAFYFEEKLSPH